MASRRNRLISRPDPIPSWGYSGSKWNYIPDAVGLGWNDPLPARCFGDWVLPEPANEIIVDWRNPANDGPGPSRGKENTAAGSGGNGQWRVTARSAVYAGTIEVGDLYDRIGVLRDDALAVADTALRIPSGEFEFHSGSTAVSYTSSDPQAGRHFLLWGVADANGDPATHINGQLSGSVVLDIDCGPGGGITYEMRNIRHGQWPDEIALDAYSQYGGGFLFFGEANVVIMRNVRFLNLNAGGWDSGQKDTNEAEHKTHTAFFATDSVLYLCGNNALEQGQYNLSSGAWITIRTVSGPHAGHCFRWGSDGLGLNLSMIGRNDEGLSSGWGLQTPLNLMPAAFFHGENLAIFPAIDNIAGYNSRGALQHVPRRSSGGYATSPRLLGLERAKAMSPYVKDETAVERWRYELFIYGNTVLLGGSEHADAALSADASGTSASVRWATTLLGGGSGFGYRDIDTDTTTDAWELVFIDWSDGRREKVDATLSSIPGGSGTATFTLSSSLSATFPQSTTIVALRQKAIHPSGEQRWDQMTLNEPYYNLRHPLCPWFDAVVPGVTPDGCWSELSWPSAHPKSLHNIYIRPLRNEDAGNSCLIELFGSLSETYRPDQGTNRRIWPPANNGNWPPAPDGMTDGSWASEGLVSVTGEHACLYGTDGSGGSGVDGTAIRDHNHTLLSDIGYYEDAGLTNTIAGQIRHTTNQAAIEQQAACWYLDSNGDLQRVIVSPDSNVSPMPTMTQTTVSGAVTGSTSEPTRTVVLASATGATVGKAIQIEMAGAMNGWGVLFDVIEAIDGATVTLRTGATHDISDGARVAIFTKAGTPPKPWQTASKLWERFKDFSMT